MKTVFFLLGLAVAFPSVAEEFNYEQAHRIAEEHRQRLAQQKLLQIERDRAYMERKLYLERELNAMRSRDSQNRDPLSGN